MDIGSGAWFVVISSMYIVHYYVPCLMRLPPQRPFSWSSCHPGALCRGPRTRPVTSPWRWGWSWRCSPPPTHIDTDARQEAQRWFLLSWRLSYRNLGNLGITFHKSENSISNQQIQLPEFYCQVLFPNSPSYLNIFAFVNISCLCAFAAL